MVAGNPTRRPVRFDIVRGRKTRYTAVTEALSIDGLSYQQLTIAFVRVIGGDPSVH